MYRFRFLLLVFCTGAGCNSNRTHSDEAPKVFSTRVAEGLGEFILEEEDMWAGNIDVDGESIKVFLHAYETDFDTLAGYAKRVLARKPLPDQLMLNDLERGMKSMDWKFKKFGFNANEIDLRRFRVERLVFGKDFDGPEIELGVNLQYPGDPNQWHLAYFSEGTKEMLNWIPKID
jgi:hypothetical protein